jgi:hypothetical protein
MRYNSPPDWPPLPQHIPWHKRTVGVTLVLIFFFPVGLVLLWMQRDRSVKRRGTVSAVVAVMAIFALAGCESATASPAAGQNSDSSSVNADITAVTSSPAPTTPTSSAAPTTAAPTVVAAAPKATTPVYKAPAPAHTTRAPQPPKPVQTEPQKQSCHPLTNGGKCYTPGELCRSSDHGVSGIDANGDAIKCENNNGWRWERV